VFARNGDYPTEHEWEFVVGNKFILAGLAFAVATAVAGDSSATTKPARQDHCQTLQTQKQLGQCMLGLLLEESVLDLAIQRGGDATKRLVPQTKSCEEFKKQFKSYLDSVMSLAMGSSPQSAQPTTAEQKQTAISMMKTAVQCHGETAYAFRNGPSAIYDGYIFLGEKERAALNKLEAAR